MMMLFMVIMEKILCLAEAVNISSSAVPLRVKFTSGNWDNGKSVDKACVVPSANLRVKFRYEGEPKKLHICTPWFLSPFTKMYKSSPFVESFSLLLSKVRFSKLIPSPN